MNRYLPDGEISYLNILILKPLFSKDVQLAIKWRPYGSCGGPMVNNLRTISYDILYYFPRSLEINSYELANLGGV